MGNSPFGNDLIGLIVYPIILGTLDVFILFILWLQLPQKVLVVLFILV